MLQSLEYYFLSTCILAAHNGTLSIHMLRQFLCIILLALRGISHFDIVSTLTSRHSKFNNQQQHSVIYILASYLTPSHMIFYMHVAFQ